MLQALRSLHPSYAAWIMIFNKHPCFLCVKHGVQPPTFLGEQRTPGEVCISAVSSHGHLELSQLLGPRCWMMHDLWCEAMNLQQIFWRWFTHKIPKKGHGNQPLQSPDSGWLSRRFIMGCIKITGKWYEIIRWSQFISDSLQIYCKITWDNFHFTYVVR